MASIHLALAMGLLACTSSGNRAPRMEAQAVTTPEDRPIRVTVIALDDDGDDLELSFAASGGSDLEIVRVAPSSAGTEAELVVVPKPNFNGEAGFTVHVSDGHERIDVFHHVTVLPVNDKPIAADDAVAAAVDTPITIYHSTLLANDDDGEGSEASDPLAIASVADATRGTATLGATTITFVPESGFAGTATFAYTLDDGAATTAATVSIAVGAPNAQPDANDDHRTVFEDTPLILSPPDLTKNDVDHDGHTLAVIAVGNATHGTVDVIDGVVTFRAEPSYFGAAGFDYTVTDGVDTDTAFVDLAIVPYL